GYDQLVAVVEDLLQLLRAVDGSGSADRVQHDDDPHASPEVLADLGKHPAPGIRGRPDLHDQIGHDGQQAVGHLTAGQALVAVVADVGPTHGVRIAPGLHEGVVAHDVAEVALEGVVKDEIASGHANLAVFGEGHRQLLNHPLDQFRVAAAVPA